MFQFILLVSARLHVMGWTGPRFKAEDNPAAFAPEWSTRAMTYSYLYAFNLLLLLHPSRLSYDWQMASIPLLQQVSDMRNLASVCLLILLLLLSRHCLLSSKVSHFCLIDLLFFSFFFTIKSA